jgi:hypothetical protein
MSLYDPETKNVVQSKKMNGRPTFGETFVAPVNTSKMERASPEVGQTPKNVQQEQKYDTHEIENEAPHHGA